MRITTAMLQKQIEVIKRIMGRNDLHPEYDRDSGGWTLIGELPDGSKGTVFNMGTGCNTSEFYNRLYGFCQGVLTINNKNRSL